MTREEIWDMLLLVRMAYKDSLEGKSISFTGVNGRSITNHDPDAIREEIRYWEKLWAAANRRGGNVKLAHFR
ncbi:hypothetical protein [Trabulsiella guamensis]|nr:hypothetical protein [Trabulsiella guamensis]